jgi:hypothetical protein
MQIRSIRRNPAPVALLAALAGVVTSAKAALPTEAQAVFTQAATDFGTISGYGFTLMAVVVGGLIVFKLVRKVASKST